MSSSPESKSEKRLHRELERAAKERTHKIESGRLSLASGEGMLSIIVSGQKKKRQIDTYGSKGRDPYYFRLEAERLEAERAGDHQDVVIRHRATPDILSTDLGNPEITDIILLGNGTINSIVLGLAKFSGKEKHFSWRHAARAATSLKQGRIEQRMCGNFPFEGPNNVPLGTFAVSDLANVTAALNMIVPDRDPDDGLFRPFMDESSGPLAQIQSLNNRYAGSMPAIVGGNGQLASI
jgi:hypothetical protein